jgi:hypothetical protein
MKMKRKTLAIPVILFLTALTSHAFAQMGGGMMGPGSGQGQGMMDGGYGQGPGAKPTLSESHT